MRFFKHSLIILAVVSWTWRATPVGRVSSSQPFGLNDALMPADGVLSWPIFSGGIIDTQEAPATVILPLGRPIVLAPNSELKIEFREMKPIVRPLRGSGKYLLGGFVIALSTAAAIAPVDANTGSSPGAQGCPQPPGPSPARQP